MKTRFDRQFAERFWARVKKGSKCWEWQAGTTRAGYGQLQARKIQQQPMLAHRVAWELRHGSILDGLHVLHKCDNPRCVRWSHLFLGTQADNNADRDRKGRVASGDRNGSRTRPERNSFVRNCGSGLCGEDHPMAKLSNAQTRELQDAFISGVPRADLAREYRISLTHVYRLGKRRRE